MEQTLMIQVSPEVLSGMIKEAVAKAICEVHPAPKKYLTRQEVSELLSISLPTVHTWTNRGHLTAHKINGRTLFEASAVEAAVKQREVLRYHRERR